MTAILGFFTSIFSGAKLYLIGGAALLAVGGAAYAYYKITSEEISTLKANVAVVQQQADALQASNTQMQKDVAAIKAATDQVNNDLTAARSASAKDATAIRALNIKVKSQTDPVGLEKTINDNWSSQFKALEDDTNAP